MNKTKLFFSAVIYLGVFLLVSCKNQKKEEGEIAGKTEHFFADLPDGEYMVDSSAGIKTYAVVQAKKLIKFRATTHDGNPSKTGIVNIRAKMQLAEDEDTPTIPCNSQCWVACVIDIDTGKDAFCACICPGPSQNGLLAGMMHTEILGPSFGKKRVKEIQTRIMFEIDQ